MWHGWVLGWVVDEWWKWVVDGGCMVDGWWMGGGWVMDGWLMGSGWVVDG